jgi:Kef-type K+ transport system membrane component KefB
MRHRTTLFYVLFVGGFTVLGLLLLKLGGSLDKVVGGRPVPTGTPFSIFWDGVLHHLASPLALLLVQIMVVLLFARLLGSICLKLGQPSVVGEIIAGIALGPSLLGMAMPQVTQTLFPPASLDKLSLLAQMGLVLFMFVIGIELDLGLIKNKAREAVIISHASIVFPFFLGIALSLALYGPYAPADTSFLSFALFMGIAMSITAFPVLARIIQERNMTRTPVGTIAITCAAADDVTAWCLLAAVVAIVQAGTFTSALFTLVLTVIYLTVMLRVVAPFLNRLSTLYPTQETLGKPVMAVIFLILLLSAWSTEIIGIHALFGAFLAGAIMPTDHNFRRILTERVEDVAMVLLLPLFFVFTGLRTQLGLLDSPTLWLVCVAVISVAVAGKLVGSAVAARFMGMTWKDSLTIGVLMNTRGLMELVVLNIGYDLGVLSAEVFTMMVMMALGTTVMTGPALSLIDRLFPSTTESTAQEQSKILISFGPPRKGSLLLGLARRLGQPGAGSQLTALHLTPSGEVNPLQAEEFERVAFASMQETADQLGVAMSTMYRATPGVEETILEEANSGAYEILLVGASRSLFSDDELGGVIGSLIDKVQPHLGVFLDRGFQSAGHVFFPILAKRDLESHILLFRLLQSGTEKVSVFDPNDFWDLAGDGWTENVEKVGSDQLTANFWNSLDLAVVSRQCWVALKSTESAWIEHLPSVLIFQPGKKPLSLPAAPPTGPEAAESTH